MEDWRIKDNKIICYNLYNKIHPYEAREVEIEERIRRIRKRYRCSELQATIIYKAELKQQRKEQRDETETQRG